jgi:tetraacyldisaccharide 4'-kinase
MEKIYKLVLNFLENKKNSHLKNILKSPLVLISIIIRLFTNAKRVLYKNSLLFKAKDPHIFTISIGNINFGGSGKTPFAFSISKYLYNLGLKPCIVSRGYGGRLKKNSTLPAGNMKIKQNCPMRPFFY